MIGLFVCVITIFLDQISKHFVYGLPAKSIIGNFLWFQSTLNEGVAFGMFSGLQIVFIVLSSICSVVFVYLILSKKWIKSKWQKFALSLILGGTISNLFDRIAFNGVRDFIYLKFINFAIFNVADMAITIGVTLLIILILFGRETKDETKS